MDPELARLLTTVGVALVGVGGTALGAWINQRGARQTAERTVRSQLQLDAARDRRSLRDQKRQRLQESFEQILLAARTLRRVLGERLITRRDETSADRDERLQMTVANLVQDLETARIHLRLEPGAEAITHEFDGIYATFRIAHWLNAVRRAEADEQSAARLWPEIEAAAENLSARARDLEQTMREALAALERPITE